MQFLQQQRSYLFDLFFKECDPLLKRNALLRNELPCVIKIRQIVRETAKIITKIACLIKKNHSPDKIKC